MKPTQFLSTILLALAVAAGSATAQDDAPLKIAVIPIRGDDGAALRESLAAGLTEAKHEVIAAETVDPAFAEIAKDLPETGIDPAAAVAIGEATGAQAVVSGRQIGDKFIAKVLSTKNATVFVALAMDAESLPAKVAEAIEANKEMLLKDPE
ncbi:MAG: hypothetical protein ACI8UO_002340 [Verrucomicrobiales bacterium]|jgi:hypothetical protein